MARQWMIPGGGYVLETDTRQWMVPGGGYVVTIALTAPILTAPILTAPANTATGVALRPTFTWS
jgi:hypothetical protein